jgi:hypothetical protein
VSTLLHSVFSKLLRINGQDINIRPTENYFHLPKEGSGVLNYAARKIVMATGHEVLALTILLRCIAVLWCIQFMLRGDSSRGSKELCFYVF